jgi:hypothetical protein
LQKIRAKRKKVLPLKFISRVTVELSYDDVTSTTFASLRRGTSMLGHGVQRSLL